MDCLRVSAPGKVILHGEHAVVYGKTAIAVSVDLRTTLTIKGTTGRVEVQFPDTGTRYCWKLEELQRLRRRALTPGINHLAPQPANDTALAAIRQFLVSRGQDASSSGQHTEDSIVAFLYLYLAICPNPPPILIKLSSQIPIGAGLGSSAALSVCFASALLLYATNHLHSNGHSNGLNGLNGTNGVNGGANSINGGANGVNGGANGVNGGANGFNGGSIVVNGGANGINGGANGVHGSSGLNGNGIHPPEENEATSAEDLNGLNGSTDDDDEEEHNEDDTEVAISAQQKDLICQWAFMAEKILHGNPSGIDNCVCTYGGVVSFCSGSMVPLSDLTGLDVLLINTGVPRNTKDLVESVKEKHHNFPKVVTPMLESMDRISLASLATLATCRIKNFHNCHQEFQTLEELIDMNQGLLCALGVSHPVLGRVVEMTGSHGLHTKLTGAGGGGFAFSLVTPTTPTEKLTAARVALEVCGFSCWQAQIGGSGVRAWSRAQ